MGRIFIALAIMVPLVALGTEAPQLPQSEYVDTEVSTNLVLEMGRHVGNFNFRLEFIGTPSNNVEVVIGTDADGDGELSFDECGMRLGWDCGRYFLERVSTGERYEETEVGTNDFDRVIDWQCELRRHRIRTLDATSESGAAFLSVTTNAPAWLYDGDWNLMRLTARGIDFPNERFVYEVTQRGHLLILR